MGTLNAGTVGPGRSMALASGGELLTEIGSGLELSVSCAGRGLGPGLESSTNAGRDEIETRELFWDSGSIGVNRRVNAARVGAGLKAGRGDVEGGSISGCCAGVICPSTRSDSGLGTGRLVTWDATRRMPTGSWSMPTDG